MVNTKLVRASFFCEHMNLTNHECYRIEVLRSRVLDKYS